MTPGRALLCFALLACFMTSPATAQRSGHPTDEEVRRAYNDYRYRLTCAGVRNCGDRWRRQPWILEASQVECLPERRRGDVRCKFVVHESIPFGAHLHICSGSLSRKGGKWRLLSVFGECYGLPPLP